MTKDDTQLISEKLHAAVQAALQGEVSVELVKQQTTDGITTFRFHLVLKKMGCEFRCFTSVGISNQIRGNHTAIDQSLSRMMPILAQHCVADFKNAAKASFSSKSKFN